MHPPLEGFYDRTTAAALVRAAAAAYGEAGEMEAWAEEQGCQSCAVVRDERTDTLGFVAASEECGFVVFRGTRDLRNWITDLDCRRVNYSVEEESGSKLPHSIPEVHEGFARALRSVWGDLNDALKRLAPGKRNIFFCGHSLGGAVAMLAAAGWDMSQAGAPGTTGEGACAPRAWVYSFGQPRVGNGAWRKWYDRRLRGRSFRIVHGEDVVARVPWLLGCYRHAGTEIFYDALAAPHQDWPWLCKLPSDALGLWKEWQHGQLALLGDHRVDTYVDIINGKGQILRRSLTAATSKHGI